MFGERLKSARENKNLTQLQMGNLLGITAAGYAKYEKEISDPNIANLTKICEELEISADWLLGIEDKNLKAETEADVLRAILLLGDAGASVDSTVLHFKWGEIISDEDVALIVINGIQISYAIKDIKAIEKALSGEDVSEHGLERYIASVIEDLETKKRIEESDPNIASKIADLIKDHTFEN